MRNPVDRVRLREKVRRPFLQRLDGIITEMLVEAGAPGRADAIAGLQDRLHARAEASAHQSEVAAVLARHQLEDGARLPVPLDADHDAFIGPLHVASYPANRGKARQ